MTIEPEELALSAQHLAVAMAGVTVTVGIYWLLSFLYLRRARLRECVPEELLRGSGRLLSLFLVLTMLSCLGLLRAFGRGAHDVRGYALIGGFMVLLLAFWIFFYHASRGGGVVLSAISHRFLHGEASARDTLITRLNRRRVEPRDPLTNFCLLYLLPIVLCFSGILLVFMWFELTNWRDVAVEQAIWRGEAEALSDYLSFEVGRSPEMARPRVSSDLQNAGPLGRIFREEHRPLSLLGWGRDSEIALVYQEHYNAKLRALERSRSGRRDAQSDEQSLLQ